MATARYNFFLNSSFSHNWAPEFSEIYPHDYFLAGVTFIGMYFRTQMAYFADGLILANSLLLWVNTAGFRKLLEKDAEKKRTLPSREILKNYETLKDLADLINSTISHVVLVFMAVALFYYAVNLNDILKTGQYLGKLGRFIFLGIFLGIFFFAGDTCRQVEYLGKWLSRKLLLAEAPGDLHSESISQIMQEITRHEVGISGHWFVLDFSVFLM